MSKLAAIRQSFWNEVFLSFLAVLSVALLVFELSIEMHDTTWLYQLDIIIACIFLADFFIGLYQSDNKKKYMQHNWYLLIASIPIPADLFQSLRVLRLLRLLRVVRMLARVKRIATLASLLSPSGSRYIYFVSITTFTVFSGAVALYSIEADINPNLHHFFDAIWWASVTITSVGYGDIIPVTWQGRLVGMALMFFGVGLIGTIAGMVGGHLLRHPSKTSV